MSADDSLYPWQQPQWQTLCRSLEQGRLPHALLLRGPAGSGKLNFARRLAQRMLCAEARGEEPACGHCRNCQLYAAGSHPDLRLIQPEETGKDIPIAAIRDLARYQSLTPQFAPYKVVIIEPAERMNPNAANALLKTLEEPTPGTVLLLVSAQPAALLPTVRSRCQPLEFPPAHDASTRAWLEGRLAAGADAGLLLAMSGGAPLAVLAMAEEGSLAQREEVFGRFAELVAGRSDPVALAASWLELDQPTLLGWLHSWTCDLLRLCGGGETKLLVNRDLESRLQEIAKGLDLVLLYQHLDRLQEALRLVRGQANTQMLLEHLLLPWAPRAGARRTATG